MRAKIKESATGITGNVSIKLMKGKAVMSEKKCNNNVTLNLLIGLLSFLRGDYIAYPQSSHQYIPACLGVGGSDAELSETSAKLDSEFLSRYKNRFDAIASKLYTSANPKSASLVISSFIPSNTLLTTDTIREIGLFSTATGNTLLARVVPDEAITVPAGYSLQIDWTITLGNLSTLAA